LSRIIGISGSLRRASFNTALLRTAVDLMPSGAELRIESIEGIPLYNGDMEAAGIPQRVAELKRAIAQAERLMVSRAQTVFDEHGKMTDETSRKQLEQFLHGFLEFIQV
jgi:hypothetical protein